MAQNHKTYKINRIFQLAPVGYIKTRLVFITLIPQDKLLFVPDPTPCLGAGAGL